MPTTTGKGASRGTRPAGIIAGRYGNAGAEPRRGSAPGAGALGMARVGATVLSMERASSGPRAAAVLVAAGGSTRMVCAGAAPLPRKPWLDLDGQPVLAHACLACARARSVVEIVVVAHPDDLRRAEELRESSPELSKVRAVVPGGRERAESVRLGARAVAGPADVIAVQDAARPLVAPELIDRTVRAAALEGAAVVAVPLADTLKQSEDGRHVLRTVDRSSLWCAQTPQAFRAAEFLELLARAERDRFLPTDDAALWERYVGPLAIVEGDGTNLKLTTPADLEIARALVALRRSGA